MNNVPKFSSHSDDEEDIEALRLAALQSLKKPQTTEDPPYQFIQHTSPEQTWPLKGFRKKRGKFHSQHQGWGRKENYGHFANRLRSSNLIPITTIPDESKDNGNIPTDSIDKDVIDSSSSKFNRYDKSDKSDSDSEEDILLSSDDDCPKKLERSNSLEALMEELDAEIQGKTQTKDVKDDKPKIKKSKKKKKLSESENKIDTKTNNAEKDTEASETIQNATLLVKSEESQGDIRDASLVHMEQPNTSTQGKFYGRKRPRSRSPHNRRGFPNRRRARNFPGGPLNQPMHIPFGHLPPLQFPPQMIPFPEQPFNPFIPQMPNALAPPFFERPVSPLSINTDSLTTATMAPLSPRSAAFVLQNKAIIERRKRSPRRSYSRSLSRSPRRSLTPRRSPRRSISPRRSRSPRRLLPRKKSLSPRKRSLSPRKRSLSPRLRRSISPRRKSLSPKRKNVEKAGDNRAPVRERLGIKSKSDEVKDKEKPKKEEDEDNKKEEKNVDPVLEARRRKFETNEIKKREGIIRLKPKDEKLKEDKAENISEKPKEEVYLLPPKKGEEKPKVEETPKPKVEKSKENIVEVAPATTTMEEKPSQSEKDLSVPDEFRELERLLNEDVLLEGDDIAGPKVDDIFSDEDSTSDNEGRFKVKDHNPAKPPIISFSKLVNGIKTEIKTEPLSSSTHRSRAGRNQQQKGSKVRDRRKYDRSHTPPPLDKKNVPKIEIVQDDKKSSNIDKTVTKQKHSLKSERHPPLMDKRFERKIEIKIKNPSKYERSGKSKVTKIEETVPSKIERKINFEDKVDEDEEDEDDDFEPEIIVENGSSSDECSNITEGDLRAQLSKKRAKKLHKIPVDQVPSRLLQYALQGAVFKKKKKSKSKDLVSSDGKLPIHLRLGLSNLDRPKRKSRKRKNREVLEQV